MPKRSGWNSEDRSAIVAALTPAAFPQWWRSYLEQIAERDRWLELAHGFTDKKYKADRVEALGIAKEYSRIEQEHSGPFWAAWRTLLDLNPGATVELPTPDTHPSRIDPDVAAAAVRKVLGMLTADQAPGEREDKPPTTRKPMKEPSANAFAAYRAVILTGMKQEDLKGRFGVGQSTISRWVRDVGKWIEAGNVLPDEIAAPPPRPKTITMDPRKLERGPRRRGRA